MFPMVQSQVATSMTTGSRWTLALPRSVKRWSQAFAQLHWTKSWVAVCILVLLLLGLSLGLWTQHEQSAQRLRQETAAQVELRGTQVISAVTASVALLFRTVDVASQRLANSFEPGKAPGFDAAVQATVEQLPPGAVLQVAVIDADGYLAYSSLGMSERMFLGDREHFKVHLADGPGQLFISKPVLGRVSKQWSIQVSRPIVRSGKLQGVLVMSMAPAYLQTALMGVVLQSDDSISVLRRSGEFLARSRNLGAALGKAVDANRPFLADKAEPAGVFVAKSLIDEVERVVHWQFLPSHPITVILGLSTVSAYQPTERAIADDRTKTELGIAALWALVLGAALLARRIHTQSQRKTEFERVAMNDALTGLSSRHALMRHLEKLTARAPEEAQRVGLLYLDLDGFKAVNDRYGHAAGDEVLQAVGRAIKGCMRSSDTAARIGGDEFVLVLSALENDRALAALQERVTRAISMPMHIAGVEMKVGVSVGSAVFPDHGQDAEALLGHADHAMYVQKGERPLAKSLQQFA